MTESMQAPPVPAPPEGRPTSSDGPLLRGRVRGPLPLLVGSGLLLLLWSLAVPIFESPDEPAHWQYARYVHENARLPRYEAGVEEANSPPLYYALVAPFAKYTEQPPVNMFSNGHGGLSLPSHPRYFQNAASDFTRYWPIRAVRVFTAVLALFAVLFTYLAGREATGRHETGLLAGALVGLLPQFSFRGMSVSNDALVTSLGAATVLIVVLLLRRGWSWRTGVLGAVTLAAAYLSKISAIFLPFPFLMAVVSVTASWTGRVKRASVLLLTLLIVLPWSVRNVLLYGDPFASATMHTAVGHIIDPKPLWSPYFVTEFPKSLFKSFVGVFGWMNVVMPRWAYWAFLALFVVAALGHVSRRMRGLWGGRLSLILLSALLLNLAVVVRINLTFSQAQGRYLFVALGATALLTALGLEGWRGWGRRATLTLVMLLGIVNVYTLAAVVVPSYWPPVTMQRAVLDIDPGRARLYGLTREERAHRVKVVDEDPRLSLPIDIEAERFDTARLVLDGLAGDGEIPGAFYFEVAAGGITEQQVIRFNWPAVTREITVDMKAHPRWRGHITTLRIDPVQGGAERFIGQTVRIRALRLEGSGGVLDLVAPTGARERWDGTGSPDRGDLVIQDGDPALEFDLDLDTDTYRILELTIGGALPNNPKVIGAVFFGTHEEPLSAAQVVRFGWSADGGPGTSRQVTVRMNAHSGWNGVLTKLRIDPIDLGAESYVGGIVRIESIRLLGND